MRRGHSNTAMVLILIVGIFAGSAGTMLLIAGTYQTQTQQPVLSSGMSNESVAEINLLAVDQNGNGVSTPLIVELRPGTGETLANIDKLLFWTDTQESIQTAKAVAENITGIAPSNYDIIYSIESGSSVVGGPSAGAALTIATMAVLQNQTLRSDIVITGTINPDGTIGQVGGVLEKAQAAKDIGANLMLVPEGQGTQTTLIPHEECETRGVMQICQTTYTQESVNIGEDVGISVMEVDNVSQAYGYFKA